MPDDAESRENLPKPSPVSWVEWMVVILVGLFALATMIYCVVGMDNFFEDCMSGFS